ncbi:hypothetical protein GUJ93_ZPchr0010g7365 [Zizania palustris]|uniref:Uncharacterized protein n=1 Tax=Zizania palustris TaxID=103762 RepID=A0A8J5WHU5_ZIZPA|nr:hypothetical protein GUJ93_ZPchr0010g7365 [Zizania palustris]
MTPAASCFAHVAASSPFATSPRSGLDSGLAHASVWQSALARDDSGGLVRHRVLRLWLLKKTEKRNGNNKDVLLATDAYHAQGWIIDGADDEDIDPISPRRSTRMRELHDDGFNSGDDEEEANEDEEEIDFESDKDEVLPSKNYDQED